MSDQAQLTLVAGIICLELDEDGATPRERLAPGTGGEAPMHQDRTHRGIYLRHDRSCATTRGGSCDCHEEATCGRKIRRIVATIIDGRAKDAERGVRARKRRTSTNETLREAWTVCYDELAGEMKAAAGV